MKRASVVLAVLIAAGSLGYAQTPARPAGDKAAPSAGAEQALMKIENEILAALLKRDAAAFGRHFADDAVLTTPDGTVQTKAQLLGDVKSGDLVLESSSISDMKVSVHGDAAVVTYATTDKGKYKKQDISGRFRWTDVFVRRGGEWKLVAGQGTPIAAQK
jgi:ketosteroid isomerase-like protein